MKDILSMIDFVKELSTLIYGKQVFFYDYEKGEWYSREHCRIVTLEEILEWLKDRVYPCFYED